MTKNLLAKLCPLALTTGIAGLGYILSHPILFGFCIHRYQFSTYTGCSDASISGVGLPLLAFASWWLFAIAIIVIFLPYAIFKTWRTFALWMLPVMALLIAITPTSSPSSLFIDFLPFYRYDAAHLCSIVFVLVSAVVLGFGFLRRHLEKDESKKTSEEVEKHMQESKMIFAALLSLVSLSAFPWLNTATFKGVFEVSLLTIITSLTSFLHALDSAVGLTYRSIRDRNAFGWKLKTTILLLIISGIAYSIGLALLF